MVRICSEKIPSMVSDYSDGFGSKLATFAEAVANIGIVIGTTPFVLFFMLKDGHKFKDYTTKIMPPKFRKDFHDLLEKMSVQVGSYIQGQIIVSFCIGLLLFIGYSIIGLKYALVLASIAAVTSVVPYLGPTIAISPAIVIAIITSPLMLLKLAVVWTLVQFFEATLSLLTLWENIENSSFNNYFHFIMCRKFNGHCWCDYWYSSIRCT